MHVYFFSKHRASSHMKLKVLKDRLEAYFASKMDKNTEVLLSDIADECINAVIPEIRNLSVKHCEKLFQLLRVLKYNTATDFLILTDYILNFYASSVRLPIHEFCFTTNLGILFYSKSLLTEQNIESLHYTRIRALIKILPPSSKRKIIEILGNTTKLTLQITFLKLCKIRELIDDDMKIRVLSKILEKKLTPKASTTILSILRTLNQPLDKSIIEKLLEGNIKRESLTDFIGHSESLNEKKALWVIQSISSTEKNLVTLQKAKDKNDVNIEDLLFNLSIQKFSKRDQDDIISILKRSPKTSVLTHFDKEPHFISRLCVEIYKEFEGRSSEESERNKAGSATLKVFIEEFEKQGIPERILYLALKSNDYQLLQDALQLEACIDKKYINDIVNAEVKRESFFLLKAFGNYADKELLTEKVNAHIITNFQNLYISLVDIDILVNIEVIEETWKAIKFSTRSDDIKNLSKLIEIQKNINKKVILEIATHTVKMPKIETSDLHLVFLAISKRIGVLSAISPLSLYTQDKIELRNTKRVFTMFMDTHPHVVIPLLALKYKNECARLPVMSVLFASKTFKHINAILPALNNGITSENLELRKQAFKAAKNILSFSRDKELGIHLWNLTYYFILDRHITTEFNFLFSAICENIPEDIITAKLELGLVHFSKYVRSRFKDAFNIFELYSSHKC